MRPHTRDAVFPPPSPACGDRCARHRAAHAARDRRRCEPWHGPDDESLDDDALEHPAHAAHQHDDAQRARRRRQTTSVTTPLRADHDDGHGRRRRRRRSSAATTDARAPRSTSRPPPRAHAAGDPSDTIVDFKFSPATVTIHVGDTITWTNQGNQPHTATASDGSFNTGTLHTGQSASHTFTKAGTFTYICSIHPFMHGTVIVQASSSASGSGSGSGRRLRLLGRVRLDQRGRARRARPSSTSADRHDESHGGIDRRHPEPPEHGTRPRRRRARGARDDRGWDFVAPSAILLGRRASMAAFEGSNAISGARNT